MENPSSSRELTPDDIHDMSLGNYGAYASHTWADVDPFIADQFKQAGWTSESDRSSLEKNQKKDAIIRTLSQLQTWAKAYEEAKKIGKTLDIVDPFVWWLMGKKWDVAMGVFSSFYFAWKYEKAGMPLGAYVKMLGYQIADVFAGTLNLGSTPAGKNIGNIADAFIQSNKFSFEQMEEYLETLMQELVEYNSGVFPQLTIEKMSTKDWNNSIPSSSKIQQLIKDIRIA